MEELTKVNQKTTKSPFLVTGKRNDTRQIVLLLTMLLLKSMDIMTRNENNEKLTKLQDL